MMGENREQDAFERLLDDAPEDADAQLVADAESRSGRGWLVASVASIAVGVLVIAGGALAFTLPAASPADSHAAPAPSQPDESRTSAADISTSPAPGSDDRTGIVALADPATASALAETTGIPERVLLAYLGASLRVAEENPRCGLGWNTLAGIGFVESGHGTHAGSHVTETGETTPAIIGIPLDGTDSNVIRDTDEGRLDGDAVWDRAVGPMQFIPSTWETWGADGNGDGSTDPQQIDDAALAAGRYLCAAGGDLTAPDRWIAAIAAYNDAVEYNNAVADAATHYANLAD